MNATVKNVLPLSTLAVSVLATFGVVVAAEADEITELSKPESNVSIGVGYVSDDNQRFGQYTGLNEEGGYGLADIDINSRDDDTGTWTKLQGHNLGFDNRDLRFEQRRQGDWGYFFDFSQTPRFDPYTVTTTLGGVGTTTQTISGSATPQEYHLKTERNALTLGFDKDLSSRLGLQVRVKSEDKDGERLWGQGHFGNWRFLTDPINQTTRQVDATISYTGEKLQLSGGYYGTAFENKNNVVTVVSSTPPIFTGSDQMALPPDNGSHQIHLAGGYSFTKTTRANFKLAYGSITQDETYATTPVAGAPNSLDGHIDTTLVQAGLTARPMSKLSLRADLRYENRDDKTPVFVYFPSNFATPSTATSDGTNEPRDIKSISGKLEASYQLPMAVRLTGGVDYVEKERNSPPVRSVGSRETTDETSLRVEFRRSIAETLTGALSYIYSTRGGSDWLFNTAYDGTTTTSNQVAPLHLADRDRNMWRLTLNWMPIDPLSVGLRLDQARDEYSGRGISVVDQAVRQGEAQNYSLDVTLGFTDDVQGTAWYSINNTSLESQLCRSSNGDVCTPGVQQVWGSDVRNLADTVGLGLRARITSKLELSADAMYSKVRDEMALESIAGAAVSPIDNINTEVTSLKLSAKYALGSNAGVRATYIFDRYETDDWTWASWNYTPSEGGTTVLEQPLQKVHFFGISGYYRWW